MKWWKVVSGIGLVLIWMCLLEKICFFVIVFDIVINGERVVLILLD